MSAWRVNRHLKKSKQAMHLPKQLRGNTDTNFPHADDCSTKLCRPKNLEMTDERRIMFLQPPKTDILTFLKVHPFNRQAISHLLVGNRGEFFGGPKFIPY